MWREPFDGWAQQGRYMAAAQESMARRKLRPTGPIRHLEITFMYFANGEWLNSKALPSSVATMPQAKQQPRIPAEPRFTNRKHALAIVGKPRR